MTTAKTRPRQRKPEKTFAAQLADTLNEHAPGARFALFRAEAVLGTDALKVVAAEAMRIIQAGGLPTMDGKRRRTPGGLVLRLIREAATDDQRRAIWPKQWITPDRLQSSAEFRQAVQAAAAPPRNDHAPQSTD